MSQVVYIVLVTCVSVVMAIAATCTAWQVAHRWLKCITTLRVGLSLALIASGTWIITLVVASALMHIEGASGPVQLWHGSPSAAMFFPLRVIALFLALMGLVIAVVSASLALVRIICFGWSRGWRELPLSAFAIGEFVVSLWVSYTWDFFPTA